jgi:hypothetical protein
MVPAYCSRGDVGVQCQIARYCELLSRWNGGRYPRNGHRGSRPRCQQGPIVLVHDSSGNQLGAQRRAYGKRDVDGRPRVRLDSGKPATKGDESKTREDIEAEGTATTKPTGDGCYHQTHFGLITIHTTPCIYILSYNRIICPFTSVRSSYTIVE